MRELIRYLKEHLKESVIGPLFKMLEACFELIVPVVMANIVDIGIKNHDKQYVWKSGIILVGLGILGIICSLTAQYFAAKAAMGFGTALRRDLFAHINKYSYTQLDITGTPTLVNRMTSDVNQAQTGVNLVLRLFLRSPFIVAGAVIMALRISVRITVIFLIAIPVISLIIFTIVKVTVPIYKKAQGALDYAALLTRENHTGARVVRAFSKQEEEIKRFENAGAELSKIQILAGRISSLMNPATYVVINLSIIAILQTGSFEVNNGVISQGELIALVNYMSQILLALLALAQLIIAFTKATASASRINEIFHTIPETPVDNGLTAETSRRHCGLDPQSPERADGKVEFDRVSFAYANSGEKALEDISFTAKRGQTIGIIGGTGSGKTTLINLLAGFYNAQSGNVSNSLGKNIAIVPQSAVLFKGTVRDNIKWGKQDASDAEIYDALSIAQAKEFVDKMPDKLDSKIQQGGKNLSGGQRQRLTIARAAVAKPDILILDDSSSALDYATDASLRSSLKENTNGMTVFLVSQRVASIRNADQILVLDDGRLAGIGNHRKLLNGCQIYKEICVSQLGGEAER